MSVVKWGHFSLAQGSPSSVLFSSCSSTTTGSALSTGRSFLRQAYFSDSVRAGAGHWRLQLAILGMTFGIFPLVVLPISWAAPLLLPSALGLGQLAYGTWALVPWAHWPWARGPRALGMRRGPMGL